MRKPETFPPKADPPGQRKTVPLPARSREGLGVILRLYVVYRFWCLRRTCSPFHLLIYPVQAVGISTVSHPFLGYLWYTVRTRFRKIMQ